MTVLFDLNDPRTRSAIDSARASGTITYEELNALLPQGEITPLDIEDTLSALSDLGIEVLDSRSRSQEERDNDLLAALREAHSQGCSMELGPEASNAISRIIDRKRTKWKDQLSIPGGFAVPAKPIPETEAEIIAELDAVTKELESVLGLLFGGSPPTGQDYESQSRKMVVLRDRRTHLRFALDDVRRK